MKFRIVKTVEFQISDEELQVIKRGLEMITEYKDHNSMDPEVRQATILHGLFLQAGDLLEME